MGATLTRNRNIGEEGGEVSLQNAYRYPPKTGQFRVTVISSIIKI